MREREKWGIDGEREREGGREGGRTERGRERGGREIKLILALINLTGLGETGRIMSALSDSYLPSMGLDDNHTHPHLQGATSGAHGGGAGGTMLNPMPHMGDNILSPEEALFPPTLSAQDRHPSAPQLASMLSSSASVDNGGKVPADVMMGEEVRVCGCVSRSASYRGRLTQIFFRNRC